MDAMLKAAVWQQFGAAIDTLHDALNLCPDHLWTVVLWPDEENAAYGQFWYIAYHALVWTDLFLGGSYKDFVPPAPFVRGVVPETPYTKAQIRNYLLACRSKGKAVIEALTDEKAYQVCRFDWMEPTFLELQLYSMRHLQEHAAQLSLVLGEHGVTGQDWIPYARDSAS